jgi:hypothetical protein
MTFFDLKDDAVIVVCLNGSLIPSWRWFDDK